MPQEQQVFLRATHECCTPILPLLFPSSSLSTLPLPFPSPFIILSPLPAIFLLSSSPLLPFSSLPYHNYFFFTSVLTLPLTHFFPLFLFPLPSRPLPAPHFSLFFSLTSSSHYLPTTLCSLPSSCSPFLFSFFLTSPLTTLFSIRLFPFHTPVYSRIHISFLPSSLKVLVPLFLFHTLSSPRLSPFLLLLFLVHLYLCLFLVFPTYSSFYHFRSVSCIPLFTYVSFKPFLVTYYFPLSFPCLSILL